MPKKTNESRPPQNALNKFMCRILFEKKQLEQAYNLDGKTVNISKVKPPSGNRKESDDVGGLVDSHLEDMYHTLYGETLNLRKLLIDAKAESVKAGVEFKLVLNPLLNAMFEVHESCIESLRIGKEWNMEAHCRAFDELNQELGVYSDRINQITANTLDKAVEPQPITKKKKGRKLTEETQKMFKLMGQLKLKGFTRKESFKSFHKTYPEVTFPKFLLLIRRHNRHIKRTNSGQ